MVFSEIVLNTVVVMYVSTLSLITYSVFNMWHDLPVLTLSVNAACYKYYFFGHKFGLG